MVASAVALALIGAPEAISAGAVSETSGASTAVTVETAALAAVTSGKTRAAAGRARPRPINARPTAAQRSRTGRGAGRTFIASSDPTSCLFPPHWTGGEGVGQAC